jgi:hypothetical protein
MVEQAGRRRLVRWRLLLRVWWVAAAATYAWV